MDHFKVLINYTAAVNTAFGALAVAKGGPNECLMLSRSTSTTTEGGCCF